MTEIEIFEKVEEVQEDTINDVLKKLRKHRKCLLIRPTGFGKTKTSVDIAKKYKHAVFLYPRNNIAMAIESYDKGDLDVHMYSYTKIRNLFRSPYEFKRTFSKLNLKNTIFIMDEAHSIGAPGTLKVIEELMQNICPKATYFGITATPKRTDRLEIKWHFFDGITAYEYNLANAFEDGIFKKPHYVYTIVNSDHIERMKKKYLTKIDNLLLTDTAKKIELKDEVERILKVEKNRIKNLDEIISNNLHKFKDENDYYKFIVFFSKFRNMHTKHDEILNAFKNVFPHCEVNIIIVSSESSRYKNNLKRIDYLEPRKNTIDLIFTVDMLTFGYHVPNLTGIMMFRETISDIIYGQQIGRCLSVMNKKSTIIFDMVQNLYKDSSETIYSTENINPHTPIINGKGKDDSRITEDQIELDENTKELMKIERLINNAITEQYEAEVIRVYKLGHIELDYAMSKLEMRSVSDFEKVLERYE